MARLLFSSLVIVLLWSPRAFGQESSPPAQADAATPPRLVADYSLWSGPVVIRDEVNLSYFGFNYRDIFAGSEQALELMRSYPGLRVSAEISYDISLISILVQLALFIADFFLDDPTMEDENGSPNGLFWGLTAGGLGLWVLGDILFAVSTARVFHAVRAYNQALER